MHLVDINRGEKTNTYNVADLSIVAITSNGFYLIITFVDGSCSVFDTSLEFLASIERPFKRDVVSLSKETKESLKARILDSQNTFSHQGSKVNQGYNSGHNFRILSLHSPCSLRLQAFDAEYRTKLFQCSYELDGAVAGYEIHPSKEYLIAISDQGFFYIFKIETGELRGKVPIMSDPLGVALDPSGLYLAVSVNNNSIEPDSQIRKKWMLKTEKYNSMRGSRTRVLFYEVGTGNLASEISSLFEISTFSFSPNGRFFVAGSKTGCVSIWAIGERLQSTMTLSPEMWASYPLYIKNEYMHEIEEANEIMIRNNPIKASLAKAQQEQPTYTMPDHRYGRAEPGPKVRARNQHFEAANNHESQSIMSDHQRLLKEREQKFLRNRPQSSERKYTPFNQTHQEEVRQQDFQRNRHNDRGEHQNDLNDHRNEHRNQQNHDRDYQQKTEQEVFTPTRSPVQRRNESPRESYSLIPPESAYFKVDDASIEYEHNENPHTPVSHNSKVPEVGSTFNNRARTADNFHPRHTQEMRSHHRESPKASNSEDDQQSSYKNESPDAYKMRNQPNQQYSLPYPQPPHQYPTAMPANVVYQSPDGKMITIPSQAPAGYILKPLDRQNDNSDSGSDTTPYRESQRHGYSDHDMYQSHQNRNQHRQV